MPSGTNTFGPIKPGNEWSSNTLLMYNVLVEEQASNHFFGSAIVPEIPKASDLRNRLGANSRFLAKNTPMHKFLYYLDQAERLLDCRDPVLDSIDFASQLLTILGYAKGVRQISSRQAIPLTINGSQSVVEVDVCIGDGSLIHSFVQTDEVFGTNELESRLIAGAIAAFQHNNAVRRQRVGLEEFTEFTFPAMSFHGRAPTFYKICVRRELSDAVTGGTRPSIPTVIHRHTPYFNVHLSESHGQLMGYLMAFRRFVGRIPLTIDSRF
ncbi:hypothetical protein AcW1_003144 [Taiwanofungus camphoratus]|nr:hypothetical protein AcV7_004739 [Antrodia cinnamomea]KAI0942546.1 hypothetical protein AcW1_003144 [Antrodia cinnamomea]